MGTNEKIINELSNKNYESYTLTLTYKMPIDLQARFSDDVIYMRNYYKYRDDYCFDQKNELGIKSEQTSRRVFNKLSKKLLNSSNITRPHYQRLVPTIIYRIELMPERDRNHGIMNTPGFVNICPVHLHAIVMIHPEVKNIDCYIGKDTLIPICECIQASHITRLESNNDLNKWFQYINKGSKDFFHAYSGTYPGYEIKSNVALER